MSYTTMGLFWNFCGLSIKRINYRAAWILTLKDECPKPFKTQNHIDNITFGQPIIMKYDKVTKDPCVNRIFL